MFERGFLASPLTESSVPKLARCVCSDLWSARLSSLLVSSLLGTATEGATSAGAEDLTCSTLETTGVTARTTGTEPEEEGLMTTGGGTTGADADTTGFGMVTGAGGRAGSG